MRAKSPADVRRDALAMVTKKVSEGCRSCADGYADVARGVGASEQEIGEALSSGRGVSRRDLLRTALVAAGGATAASTLPMATVLAGSSSAVRSTATLWLAGRSPDSDSLVNLIGFSGQAGLTAQIAGVSPRTVRSSDGRLILAPGGIAGGSGVGSQLVAYDAGSGTQLWSIAGASLATGGADRTDHETEPYLSPDGRYLALLRSMWRQFGSGGSKSAPPRRDFFQAIEVFDLTSRRTAGIYVHAPIEAQRVSAEHLVWGADSASLFEFSRRFDGRFSTTLTELAVGGGQLSLAGSLTSNESDGTLPVYIAPDRYTQRVAPDNRTLVRYAPGPRVERYDLRSRTFLGAAALDEPLDESAGKWIPRPAAAIHPAGSMIAAANSSTGRVWLFEAISGKALGQRQLPGGAAPPRESFRSASRASLAFADLGRRLMVVDNRGSQGGAWMLRVPDLAIEGRFLPDQPLSAVAAAPDGSALFALSRSARRVFAGDAAGGSSASSDSFGAAEILRAGATALMGD